MLLSANYGVRVIVLASTIEAARAALPGTDGVPMMRVPLRPLLYRTGEIDQLMDRRLAEKNATVRTADLCAEDQAALRAYPWPRNLAELREIAGDIAAYAAYGGLRGAAKALGCAHQTLAGRFGRVGLTLKGLK
jgi:transcriptional regulator with AAA-type ATPase domain